MSSWIKWCLTRNQKGTKVKHSFFCLSQSIVRQCLGQGDMIQSCMAKCIRLKNIKWEIETRVLSLQMMVSQFVWKCSKCLYHKSVLVFRWERKRKSVYISLRHIDFRSCLQSPLFYLFALDRIPNWYNRSADCLLNEQHFPINSKKFPLSEMEKRCLYRAVMMHAAVSSLPLSSCCVL